MYFSFITIILMIATIRIPNQGLKNGKKAIELSMVLTIRLMLVKLNIYSKSIETK